MSQKNITEEQLVNLYLIQNLSKQQTCKALNISAATFTRYTKRFQIKKSHEQVLKRQEQTNLQKYGTTNPAKADSIKNKTRDTNQQKYGMHPTKTQEVKTKFRKTCKTRYGTELYVLSEDYKKKFKTTCLQKFGTNSPFENKLVRIKAKKTLLERYGVDNFSKSKEWKSKSKLYQTKRYKTLIKNNTILTQCSKTEEQAYQLLVEKFGSEDVLRQYRSEVYPFNCDFYIKSLDLYIECQFSHFHYKEPFDMNRLDHLKRLEDLKQKELEHRSKQKSVYTSMIYTWTESDPLKRKTAKENNLNWIEFFSLKDLQEWLA